MIEMDVRQNFIFKDHAVRGTLVRLKQSYQTIIHQHHYPALLGNILGECLLGVTLVASFLKHRAKLTLQFQGEGDLSLLSACITEHHEIRGLVKASPELISPKNLLQALKNGHLMMTYEPERIGQPYQSVIEVKEPLMGNALRDYFMQSEQLPTEFVLFSDKNMACGLMLQVLPEQAGKSQEEFHTLVTLAQTLTFDEFKTCDFTTILKRLFHEYDLELYPSTEIHFGCNCTLERMQNAILAMGVEEAEDILDEDSYIEVSCEFCGRSHMFDEEDVERIFAEAATDLYH